MVHLDIAWYQQIAEEDQEILCKVLERPEVQEALGKEGQVSLLVKKDHLPAAKGNLRGITIAPHISKLQPSAYYAERGMQAYEKALGGPLMVEGVKRVSMVEVVMKVMMPIDIAIITDTVVDIAISDRSQYYDNIPQDAHPEVGEAIGLGTKEELQRYTEGYSAVVPLGEHETLPMPMGKGVPQGSVQGYMRQSRWLYRSPA